MVYGGENVELFFDTEEEMREYIESQSKGIRVEVRTIYTVHLEDEDVTKVKKWIKEHEDELLGG